MSEELLLNSVKLIPTHLLVVIQGYRIPLAIGGYIRSHLKEAKLGSQNFENTISNVFNKRYFV